MQRTQTARGLFMLSAKQCEDQDFLPRQVEPQSKAKQRIPIDTEEAASQSPGHRELDLVGEHLPGACTVRQKRHQQQQQQQQQQRHDEKSEPVGEEAEGPDVA